MKDKLLRAEEVAEILAISKAFAYQLMRNGTIPSIRFGRSVRVRQRDLEHLLKGCSDRDDHNRHRFDLESPMNDIGNLVSKGLNHD